MEQNKNIIYNVLAGQEAVYGTEFLWSQINSKRFIRVKNPKELIDIVEKDVKINYIFFFHWGWIVPESIYKKNKCVVIHTSNLPDGRGGSPLQNQIVKGIWSTTVCALKMVKELDAGPIYLKEPITLQGTITDIWLTIAKSSKVIIEKMIDLGDNIFPLDQECSKNLVKFKRRKDNKIPFEKSNNLLDIYDFIRMLDGGNYPKSYYDIGEYRLEFNRASLKGTEGNILADVRIFKR